MAKSPTLLRAACALLLSTLPFALLGEESTPASSPAATALTLDECVARALQKNFSLKIQGYDSANARETLTIAQAAYVPVFSAQAEKSGTKDYLTRYTSGSSSGSVAVSQKITTGAIVSLSSGLSYDKLANQLVTPSSLNPAYIGNVTLGITQPLLNGAGSTVNKAAINRAHLGVGVASLLFKSQVLLVIDSVENAYYAVCYANEQLAVRKHSMELAQALYEEAVSRKQVGVATDLDVLQSQVGVETARRNVILAEQSVKDSKDNLMNLIGQFEFSEDIGAVTFPDVALTPPSFDASYRLAKDNQPDYLATQQAIKQQEIDASTAKNARLPSLDLSTSLGYNTRESSAGRAYDQLPGSDGYAWQVGLTFSMPWGLKAENARYRSALNTLNQSRTRLRQQEQLLMLDVRTAVRSVQANIDSVQVAAKATELSEKQYELERARFDAGLSTSRLVLQAQDDLEQARISELQSKVSLRMAVAALHQLEGSSLERFHVQLPTP